MDDTTAANRLGDVTSEEPEVGRLVLLGENFGDWGAVASTRIGSRSAAAISVGSDQHSPSGQFKHDPRVSNEDALCLIDAGDWVGMAVADAHYGPESSHMLIARLHDIWAKIAPTDPTHLAQMVEFLRNGEPAQTESETTLLVAVFERSSGHGYGLSFGDSTLTVLGRGREPVAANPHDVRFVSARHKRSLEYGAEFTFSAEPGELVVVHTDGVNGCHYRSPETSVQPEHLAMMAEAAEYDPLEVVREITLLALAGVGGNPGGQDNIAIAASAA